MGDALPFIKLAASMSARGLKSAFLGNEKFVPLAASMGVECFPVSSTAAYERTYNDPLTWSRHQAHKHYKEFHLPAIKPTFTAIQSAVLGGGQPLIIYQDIFSGARMAAEKFGLKSCQVVLAPHGIDSSMSPAYPLRRQVEERLWAEICPKIKEKAKRDAFDRLVSPLINIARKELGLSEWTFDGLPDTQSSPSILALFPEWLKGRPGDWPPQLVNTGFVLGDAVGGHADEQLDDFINKYGAPLIFTFGTGMPVTGFLVDKIAHLCRVVGKPGVFVAHSQHRRFVDNGDYPVLTLPSASFGHLFPRSALVLHHGGIGTCAQALACGIPQIISPCAFDQPDNAFLLWELGVSNSVDFLSDPVEKISIVVDELLSDNVIDKVKEIQALITDETESSVSYLSSLRD